eukprot:TRINITY_DN8701_c0_g1_i1.p1 TRINITY_DN8701_c0_g1~~TRINITY_DN8701_c0_g1_i1.p1  ORF type:complete len:665 (-),score=183.51 TRINITY_DN8701_c0_g1_i1:329-2323(-)
MASADISVVRKKSRRTGTSVLNSLGTNKIGRGVDEENGEGVARKSLRKSMSEDYSQLEEDSKTEEAAGGGGGRDDTAILKELKLLKAKLTEVAAGQRQLQAALESGACQATCVAPSAFPTAVNDKAAFSPEALNGVSEENQHFLNGAGGVAGGKTAGAGGVAGSKAAGAGGKFKPAPVSLFGDKKNQLKKAFREAEKMEEEEEKEAAFGKTASMTELAAHELTDKEHMEAILDSVMGCIISVNAVYIGIAMDLEDGSAGWVTVNWLFTTTYVLELFLKIVFLRGIRDFYTGPDAAASIFDTLLAALDLSQLIMNVAAPDVAENMENAPSASVFRILRLAKLARLLRLLRSEAFADLRKMIQGMIGGTTTLVWAMVLFFLVMYVVSLMHREFYGRRKYENIYEYFDSVPRAVLTTYRCGFGDCSTSGGTPIFEFIHDKYGWLATLFYLMFIFSIAVGLLNVISAMFVESTIEAAHRIMHEKKKERLADSALWSENVKDIVNEMLKANHELNHGPEPPKKLSNSVEDIFKLDIPCSVIEHLVRVDKHGRPNNPEMIKALEALDIDPEDNPLLSDIFDPDNGGYVTVADLVDGLRKLRGDPRRSDIVTVDLMIRSMQEEIHEILQRARAADGDGDGGKKAVEAEEQQDAGEEDNGNASRHSEYGLLE